MPGRNEDAAGLAALFEPQGHSVGFDGSEMHGPAEIESMLEQIFADHETARYVAKVRDVLSDRRHRRSSRRRRHGPCGQTDLNPDVNAVQTLLVSRDGGDWRIAPLQNTPAQYHGRPDATEALTAELRELL